MTETTEIAQKIAEAVRRLHVEAGCRVSDLYSEGNQAEGQRWLALFRALKDLYPKVCNPPKGGA